MFCTIVFDYVDNDGGYVVTYLRRVIVPLFSQFEDFVVFVSVSIVSISPVFI